MSDNLVKRVRRIISGNIADLIDSLEQKNAGVVMREAIREVEDAIGDVQDELGHAASHSAQLSRHIVWLQDKHHDLEEQVRLALDEGREDLAEAAITRQMELEKQIAAEQEALSASVAREKEFVDMREQLSERRRDMEKQYRDWMAAARQAGEEAFEASVNASGKSPEKRAEEAGKAFERAITGGEFAADAEVLRETAAKMNELDKMSRDKEIARRLAKARARHENAA